MRSWGCSSDPVGLVSLWEAGRDLRNTHRQEKPREDTLEMWSFLTKRDIPQEKPSLPFQHLGLRLQGELARWEHTLKQTDFAVCGLPFQPKYTNPCVPPWRETLRIWSTFTIHGVFQMVCWQTKSLKQFRVDLTQLIFFLWLGSI